MSETQSISPLIPAATVILLRDGQNGLETLMLRRNLSLKSFGGAWVFPGGKVDPADAPGGGDIERAKAASCRETHEETGLTIAAKDLVSLSHWIPPVQEKRRFSTRFFLAKAPSSDVKIDEGEIHDFSWVSPKSVIRNAPDSNLLIMPPTYVSLHDISRFSSVDETLSAISLQSDELFMTKFQRTETGFVTYWEKDAAYENDDLAAAGPRRRLVTGANEWKYEKVGL